MINTKFIDVYIHIKKDNKDMFCELHTCSRQCEGAWKKNKGARVGMALSHVIACVPPRACMCVFARWTGTARW